MKNIKGKIFVCILYIIILKYVDILFLDIVLMKGKEKWIV